MLPCKKSKGIIAKKIKKNAIPPGLADLPPTANPSPPLVLLIARFLNDVIHKQMQMNKRNHWLDAILSVANVRADISCCIENCATEKGMKELSSIPIIIADH